MVFNESGQCETEYEESTANRPDQRDAVVVNERGVGRASVRACLLADGCSPLLIDLRLKEDERRRARYIHQAELINERRRWSGDAVAKTQRLG